MRHCGRLAYSVQSIYLKQLTTYLTGTKPTYFHLHISRELEDEYTSYAASVVRRASLVDSEEQKEKNLCPICHLKDMGGENQNACVDCERIVCVDCGSYETSLQTMVCMQTIPFVYKCHFVLHFAALIFPRLRLVSSPTLQYPFNVSPTISGGSRILLILPVYAFLYNAK